MPRFTCRIAFLAAWGASLTAIAQTNEQMVGPALQPSQGDLLVIQIVKTLKRCASLRGRVRHQSQLYEETLVGSGIYWQQAQGDRPVSRLEIQTQLGEATASYVQVYDGEYLWSDRRYPSGRQVRRLDVSRLESQLQRLTASGKTETPLASMLTTPSVRGGLSQMLVDLAFRFHFESPRRISYNGKPALAMLGHWRTESLKALWPEYDPKGVENGKLAWPVQLPHHVLLLVDPNRLLPYAIEERRFQDAYLANTVTGLRPSHEPLLRFEIFDVEYAIALDNQLFEYKPGDAEWTDETASLLESYRYLASQGTKDGSPRQ